MDHQQDRGSRAVTSVSSLPHVKARRRYLEDAEAAAFVKWFDLKYPQFVDLMWHTPNERSSAIEAKRLAAVGVRPGVPDFTIAVPARGFHGAYIELKHTKAAQSRISDAQVRKLQALERAGYFARCCFGLDGIMATTAWYLEDANALPR